MRSTNFVAFFTVQGFFIGIVFALLKAQTAEGLLIYTLLVTAFFYLMSHLFVAFYFQTMTVKAQFFPKDLHERDLDSFVREINKREQLIESMQEMTRELAQSNAEARERDKEMAA